MEQENDKNLEIALWRYGLISPLLHRDANDLTLNKMLDMASSRRYVHPNGTHVLLSGETFGACQASCRLLLYFVLISPHIPLMTSDEQLGAHSQP
nr:hypothetical protein [uncultured Desulfobacter sp.]